MFSVCVVVGFASSDAMIPPTFAVVVGVLGFDSGNVCAVVSGGAVCADVSGGAACAVVSGEGDACAVVSGVCEGVAAASRVVAVDPISGILAPRPPAFLVVVTESASEVG